MTHLAHVLTRLMTRTISGGGHHCVVPTLAFIECGGVRFVGFPARRST